MLARCSRGCGAGAIRPVTTCCSGAWCWWRWPANITALRRFAYVHQELRKQRRAPPLPAQGADPLTGWVGRAWVASVMATLVDYGTFTSVELAGVYTGTSRALGALLGAITNFTVNKLWTFRTQGDLGLHEVPRYARSRSPRWCSTLSDVVLLTDGLRWEPPGPPRWWACW